MTIPLLENPLIQKYFGCSNRHLTSCTNQAEMALNILQAMCEPIKLQERFLIRDDQSGEYRECSNREYGTWHPTILRLPDQFQPERKHGACIHKSDCAVHNEPAFPNGPCDCKPDPAKGDAVESSPQYVVQFGSHGDAHELEIDLECLAKALADLAKRETK